MKILVLACAVLVGLPCEGQLARRDGTAEVAPQAARRIRLYLKDGSYQVVTSYRVSGDRVRYVSAERGGEPEEVPLKLVDLPATERWTREHSGLAAGTAGGPALDPELAKEEADRAALTPEVAKDLRLPEEGQVWVMDTFRGGAELVPVAQTDGTVNKPVGHSILKGVVKPESAPHGVVVLKDETAPVQLHVSQPEFYLRLDDAQVPGGSALTVDTHGAAAAAAGRERKAGEPNDYVVVRVDVRQDARVVGSFNNTLLGTGRAQDDVTEVDETVLPGGHWLKVVPKSPLLIGEYALVEVLGDKTINLGVWDFGVHPQAIENRDALRPEVRRTGLGKRE